MLSSSKHHPAWHGVCMEHMVKLHSLICASMQRLRLSMSGCLRVSFSLRLAMACRSYMKYLKKHVAPLVPGEAGDYLEWLPGGTNNKQLLSLTGREDVLHYHNIRGNTDAAVITRASRKAKSARIGLCMLFELKRGVEDRHIYQALCQLMLANTLSSSKRPVMVLTDLKDHWQLFWLAGCTVYTTVMSRGGAVAAIKMCLQQAAARASRSKVPEPAVPPQLQELEQLLQRPEPQLSTPVGPATAQLSELEGCLPESELQELRVAAVLEQVALLPAFCGTAMASSWPEGMYT